MVRLSEVCDVRSGYTARERLRVLEFGGGVPAIQLGDFGADGEFPSRLTRYDVDQLPNRYFISGGEVVFRSRGQVTAAMAVPTAMSEPVLVVSPLMVVRPRREALLPEYLAWAINQLDAQRRLGAAAQGTGLRMIPMAVLEDLEIAVPDLLTQRRIVELAALARQEGRLLRQLAARREDLLSAILGEAAKAADQKEVA